MTLSAQAKTEYLFGLTTQGIRIATVEQIELGFNHQLESISKSKGYLMKIKVFQNEEQLTNLLLDKQITGYFGSPLLAVQYQQKFNQDLLYTPVLNNKAMQRYLLLVRKDSGISQLKQLKNKSLSYCNSDEVGMMYLQKRLRENKAGSVNAFFNDTKVKKNPNLTIFAVFFKEAQAAIALEADFEVAAELNPQLKQQLTAIEVSPDYITNVLAITSDLQGPMTTTEYANILHDIDVSLKNNGLLKSFDSFSNLRKIKTEDLNSVRDLIKYINLDKAPMKK